MTFPPHARRRAPPPPAPHPVPVPVPVPVPEPEPGSKPITTSRDTSARCERHPAQWNRDTQTSACCPTSTAPHPPWNPTYPAQPAVTSGQPVLKTRPSLLVKFVCFACLRVSQPRSQPAQTRVVLRLRLRPMQRRYVRGGWPAPYGVGGAAWHGRVAWPLGTGDVCEEDVC